MSLSTIFLIIYFALVAVASFNIWAPPAIVVGIVALCVIIFLIAGK